MRNLLLSLAVIILATSLNAGDHGHNHDFDMYLDQVPFRFDQQQQLQIAENNSNWLDFQQQHPNWVGKFDPNTEMPLRAFGTPIEIATSGDWEIDLRTFITDHLEPFGLDQDNIELRSVNNSKKYQHVHFYQTYQNLEVMWSEITFRVNSSNAVMMFGIDYYPNIDISIQPSLTAEAVIAKAELELEGPISSTAAELKVLPVAQEDGYDYRLIYVFRTMTEAHDMPGKYYTLADAHTGQVLYRQNEVVQVVDAQLNGTVTENPNVTPTVQPIPYANVTINGLAYVSDANGAVSTSDNGPVNATFELSGDFCEIFTNGGNTTPSFSTTLNSGANTVSWDGNANGTDISVYASVNAIHDHMKNFTPAGFTDLDFPMESYVDITNGSCNAYYDGNINFFAPGGGCPATSLFADVVYHEYGHGINNLLYGYYGSNMQNGAMNEGYADVWSLSLTQNPILGQGFQGGTGTFVRRYDVNPKVYPYDLVGQVHADGEIIAGAWWDLAGLFGSFNQMMNLFIETYPATPNEASGNEGVLYSNILLETLMADDDDGDLSNASPNAIDIIQAFDQHGITLEFAAQVSHTNTHLIDANTSNTIDASLNISPILLNISGGTMYYRVLPAGLWFPVQMTNTSGADYTAQIPGGPKGNVVAYYFDFLGANNNHVIDPFKSDELQPNLPYFTLIGYAEEAKEDFDGSTLGTWQVDPFGSDLATTGNWEIGTPIGSDFNGTPHAIDEDHTDGGTDCAFTENGTPGDGAGAADVDGGHTTIMSPAIDMTVYSNPAISYWRYFTNDLGSNPETDHWKVHISNDGNNWHQIERNINSDRRWRKNAFRVMDYVSLTNTVYLLFEAEDTIIPILQSDGGSLVEGAFDDVIIYDEAEKSVGIAETAVLDFEIVPNPTNSDFTIRLDQMVDTGTLDVYDSSGKLVYTHKLTMSHSHNVDVRSWPSGVYQVIVRSDHFYGQSRLVKQ